MDLRGYYLGFINWTVLFFLFVYQCPWSHLFMAGKYSFLELSWLKNALFILLEVWRCRVSGMLLKLWIHLKSLCASKSNSYRALTLAFTWLKKSNLRLCRSYVANIPKKKKSSVLNPAWSFTSFFFFEEAVKGLIRSNTSVALQTGGNQK